MKRLKHIHITVGIALLLLVGCGPSTPTPTPTLDPQSSAGQGRILFQTHCGTCHALVEDVVIVGPSLAHIATRAAERVPDMTAAEYIRESVLYPNEYTVEGFPEGTMQQNFAMQLTSDELDQIVAFLLTQE